MYFSRNLKYLLAVSNKTPASLGLELKISSVQVGRYISGKSQPKMEGLIEIGKLFDVALDDLVLKDLTQEKASPFVATDGENADVTLKRMNKLLEQRVAVLERELKERDPDLAKALGIE